jgi:ParB family chromosome partitioning protein
MSIEEKIVRVPISDIRISPFQPRRIFSSEELEELAASLKSVGLIQPPVVRAIKTGSNILYYELIAGERRWRAATLLEWENIPVIVKEYSDASAAQSTLIENLQRVDLNPIEMALALKRLLDVFRMTQEEVADKVGKKRSTVANYLRLLNLPDSTQQALASGKITMGHAKALLAVGDPAKMRDLEERICKQNLTVREAERASRKQSQDQVEIFALQDEIMEHLQAKITINHLTTGSGQIIISYQNIDDLDLILERMGINRAATY